MKLIFFTVTCFFIIFSCTEEIPVRPVYTGNTNWVPDLYLVGNNLKRFEVTTYNPEDRSDNEVPLEIRRNISSYYFELRTQTDTVFAVIDSSEGWHPGKYLSDPLLVEGNSYVTRAKVKYRDGTERISNEIAFTAPHVKGEVLKRIYLPEESPLYARGEYALSPGISFDNGYLYIFSYGNKTKYISRVDTITHKWSIVTDSIAQNEYNHYTFLHVNNGNIYLQPGDENKLQRINLEDMVVLSEIRLHPFSRNDYVYFSVFAETNNKLYIFVDEFHGDVKMVIANSQTGEIAKTYTPENFGALDFTTKDSTILGLAYDRFNPHIEQFDFNTTITTGLHKMAVPIFDARGLAWDGSNFWVYDPYTRSLAKIKPEPL